MNVELHLFEPSGWVPNNPLLPLILYHRFFTPVQDLAATIEQRFAVHGWPPAWRYGIYSFPHYHSNAHEVIGVFRGKARVRLGHEAGSTMLLQAGDAVVIPAGVGHECLEEWDDFQAVGAYPEGSSPDLIRDAPDDLEAIRDRVDAVNLPQMDPLAGAHGPLVQHWRVAANC